MNTSTKLAIGLFILITTFAQVARAEDVKLTFKVKVPASTPADAKVFLAGDAEKLGAWKADGLEVGKNDDGTYSVDVELPKDKQIEYKLTRGSWETVEKKADGSELDNRKFTPSKDETVEVTVAAWADKGADKGAAKPAEKQSTRTGDIREHRAFASKFLSTRRDVLVWLPPGYEQNRDQRYPVLYMHDGQNVFDAATSFVGEWQADETAARLIGENKIAPIIIVAAASTSRRMDEYTMTRDPKHNAGGEGAAYVHFICDELKPFIDTTYRTKTDRAATAIWGSSLGGTMSLEIAAARPDLFAKCAAMSPSLWWNNGELLKRLQANHDWMKNCRVWIDMGTAEQPNDPAATYLAGVRTIGSMLKQTAASAVSADKTYAVHIIERAAHNEAAWAKRFDEVLMFLFPASTERSSMPANRAGGDRTA